MHLFTLTTAAFLLSAVLATAQTDRGVGPVYQALQQQGFTNMQTVRDRNRIRITAQRGDQTRELVYDAASGKLIWDNLDPNRDQTRDRLYQQDFERDRDRDRLRDHTGEKEMDRSRDQDRSRDSSND